VPADLRRFAPYIIAIVCIIAAVWLFGPDSTETGAGDAPPGERTDPARQVEPAAAIGTVACNPFNDSCPEGTACSVDFPFADTWDCRPVGVVERLQECSDAKPCKAGLSCTDGHKADIGRCVQHCDPADTESCAEGQFCLWEPIRLSTAGQADGSPFASFGVCYPTCKDPVGNDCPGHATCTALDDSASNQDLCLYAGDRPAGAACNFDQGQCVPGLVCMGNCKQPCPSDPEAARSFDGCPKDQRCVARPEARMGACETVCEPGGASCSPGQACVPSLGDIEAPVWSCGTPGKSGRWHECENPFDCADGLACLSDMEHGGARVCVSTCDPQQGLGCPAGETCFPVPGSGAAAEDTQVGLCYSTCDESAGRGCPEELICFASTVLGGKESVCTSPRSDDGMELPADEEVPEWVDAAVVSEDAVVLLETEGPEDDLALVGPLLAGAECGRELGYCTDGLYCAERCLSVCSGEAGGACEGSAQCIGGLVDDWKFCLEPCKDVVGNDCAEGFTCAISPDHPDRPMLCLPAGSQREGEPCGFQAEACSRGLVCEDTCRRVCAEPGRAPGSGDLCGADRICATLADDAPSFCISPCNPFDDKCGAQERCNLVSVDSATWTCGPVGSAKAGANCGVAGDCGPGMACEQDRVGPGAQCVRYCEPSTGEGCQPGERCVAADVDEDRKGGPGVAAFGLCQR